MIFEVRIHAHDGDVIYRRVRAASKAEAEDKGAALMLGHVDSVRKVSN